MQLDKVKTPEVQSFSSAGDDVKVRDFGNTPDISRCTTPSPTVVLQRREALISRDTEVQDRLIKGLVVTTRRPSTKGRAHTIDDRSPGLEAWLRQDAAKAHSADAALASRGPIKHRENTL